MLALTAFFKFAEDLPELVGIRPLTFLHAVSPVGGSVSEVAAPENKSIVCLSLCAEQNTDAGAPQLPMLPLQCNPEDSSSLNATMQGKNKRQILKLRAIVHYSLEQVI